MCSDGMTEVTVLIGPSGVGKSTVLDALAERLAYRLVRTVTTRPRRLGENDLTHEFVDEKTFDESVAGRRFLGTHELYGHRYGLPYWEAGDGPVVVCIRASVVPRLRTLVPGRVDVIALDAPVEELVARLRRRGDHDRVDAGVLAAELAEGRTVADLVVDATAELAAVVDQVATRINRET